MTKQQFYGAVRSADISDFMWIDNLLKKLTNRYAAGYLTCFTEDLAYTTSVTEEEFREEVLNTDDYDIWD